MFRRSLCHTQGELLSLLKTICLFKVGTMVELQNMKYIMRGVCTQFFTGITQYWLVVMAEKFF
jgi:hypothetical protein